MFQFILFGLSIFIVLRAIYLIRILFNNKVPATDNVKKVKTAIVLGSGGHTAEMLRLTQHLDPLMYRPRIYLMARTDIHSYISVEEKESGEDYTVVRLPRSREVAQSYITSVFTTIYSTLYSVPVMLYHRPDLLLCNGPGTCIPVCVVAFLMNLLLRTRIKILFIESICRVKTLSLTGKILLFIADEILVQWPDLQRKYQKTHYIGRL